MNLAKPLLQRPAEVALFLACAQNVAARILNLLDLSSSAPLERYILVFCAQHGGGLDIIGTATLVDSNVYSNVANYVRSRSEPAYS